VLLPLAVVACFGARHLPAIYGALMVALLPGGVVGPLAAAWSFDALGSYRPAFGAFAVGNVVALVGLAVLPLARAACAARDGTAGTASGR